ncbi:MAG: TIM barrel protein [Akkermansiaceae bacterium]
MNRRNFTKLTIAGALAGPVAIANAFEEKAAVAVKAAPFKALFAPHLGMLATSPGGYKDQMQFAYDHGFRAWEDNYLASKDRKIWDVVGEFCKDKKMTMGVSVITAGKGFDFSNLTAEQKATLEADLKLGIELNKATNQGTMTYVPGNRNKMTRDEQIIKVADTVKHHCDLVEEHGIILCNEPISHPMRKAEPLLQTFAHGHKLCKAVNRKSCKLLADFYHEGEMGLGDKLIENAEAVWDEVAYVQYGDSPGRKEPGTGNLDLGAVTKWLRKVDYNGVIGLEHGVKGKGKEGLDALIAAYRKIDA